MVAQWGYSKERLGATSWESPDGNGGFGPIAASPETERKIDVEVKGLVAKAYATTKGLLTKQRAMLEEMTEMLIEKETIDYNEVPAQLAPRS